MRPTAPKLALAAVMFAGCPAPTEVVVFLDTNLGVPCLVDTLAISVSSGASFDERIASAEDGPLSLAIVQESSASDVEIKVEARKGEFAVASGTIDGAFAVSETRSVHAVLTSDCIAVPCAFGTADFEVPDAEERGTCDGISNQYEAKVDVVQLETIPNACALGGAVRRELGQLSDEDIKVSDGVLLDGIMNELEFSFYGKSVSTVWMSDDGYISFADAAPGATADRVGVRSSVTVAGTPAPAIIPFWEDLEFAAAGQACAALQTSGDQQTLWLTWDNACLGPTCAMGDDIQITVGLEEKTNRVLVGFESMTSTTDPLRAAGNGAVFGIVGPGPYACTPQECGQDGLCFGTGVACGFTQVFAEEAQTENWPATYIFAPISE